MTKLPLAIGLVLLQAATLAAAQTQTQTPTGTTQSRHSQPAFDSAGDPLSGPVIEQSDAHSLVVYEYTGQLQELGLPLAEAALELLDLDGTTAEAVGRVLTARAMLAEQLIIDNFDLVSQGEAVEASGSKLEKGVFFLRVLRALHPLIERGSLEDEIRAVLPEPVAADYDTQHDEYCHAVGAARVEDAHAKGATLSLRKAIREARRDQLGKEVELAAKRALESERFVVDYLTRGLGLSAEQEARIQSLVTGFVADTMGDSTEQDKERLFVGVLAFLNDQQRTILIDRIRGL